MIRVLLIISLFSTAQECLAQALFTQSSSQLYMGSASSVHITGDAVLAGGLSNEGLLEFNRNVNFMTNEDIGQVKLAGLLDQFVVGENLRSSTFELSKENLAILLADTLSITNDLILNTGILAVPSSKLVVVSGLISGGSELSYVTGALSVVSSESDDLMFPVGIGREYQPLTIQTAPFGEITVEAQIADPSTLVPGDSLIGLASGASWKVTAGENTNINSNVSINYNNLDLQNFPIDNPIRANKYGPVIAYLNRNGKYSSLEIGEGSDKDVASFGYLISNRPIHLNDSSVYLSIGVTPLSDGLKFYVPNIFTPTGSMSENRTFRSFLLGTEIREVNMTIWDKFNNEVYSEFVRDTPLDQTGWDGVYANGMAAPQGVYYYSVTVNSSGGIFEKTGTVLLIR